MNLFDIASAKQQDANSRKRGNNTPLRSTISIPFFKGLYRRGDDYNIVAHVIDREKKGKKVVESRREVSVPVKPLAGAFILTRGIVQAQCIVNAENAYRNANNFVASHIEDEVKPPVRNSIYLVEALLSEEGFVPEDYAQGKVTGAKRVATHIKAIAEQRKLSIGVDEQGTIQGVTPEIVNAVLSAT